MRDATCSRKKDFILFRTLGDRIGRGMNNFSSLLFVWLYLYGMHVL